MADVTKHGKGVMGTVASGVGTAASAVGSAMTSAAGTVAGVAKKAVHLLPGQGTSRAKPARARSRSAGSRPARSRARSKGGKKTAARASRRRAG